MRCSVRGARSYRSFTAVAAGEATAGERYGSNRITLDGAQVDVGFSVDLTIDPTLQALAQKTAACYTGRQDVCRALGIHRGEDGTDAIGHRLLERAVVRMAAVAIDRRCERAHRSARRARSLRARARNTMGPGERQLRHALAVSGPLPPGRAAESGGVPRCDAGVGRSSR